MQKLKMPKLPVERRVKMLLKKARAREETMEMKRKTNLPKSVLTS